MPQHLILRGSGGRKYLPWARNKLRSLRDTTDLDYASHWFNVSDARVGIKWCDDEEWISITGAGFIIFGLFPTSNSYVFRENSLPLTKSSSLRRLSGGVVTLPLALPVIADAYFLAGVVPVGGRRILLVIGARHASPFSQVNSVYDSLDGGVTRRELLSFPTEFPNETVRPGRGGPVVDDDDKVIGKRYLLLGLTAYRAALATGGPPPPFPVSDLPALVYSNNAGTDWIYTIIDFPLPPQPSESTGVGGISRPSPRFISPIAVGRNKLLAIGGGFTHGRYDDAHGDTPFGLASLVVIRSTDGGAAWSALPSSGLTTDLNADDDVFWSVLGSGGIASPALNGGRFTALGNNKIVFTVRAGGASNSTLRSYTSLNGGLTWSAFTVALPHTPGEADILFSIFSDPPLAIGGNSVAFRYTPLNFGPSPSGETVIVRTLNRGASWQRLPTPIFPGKIRAHVGTPTLYRRSSVDPEDEELDLANAVLMIPVFDAGITYLYVSMDSGASWVRGAKIVEEGPLGITNAFFHMGSLSRPQAADIGAKGLFSAD